MLYSKVNDPSTFDVEAFEFKDAEEAERCAKFLNRLLNEDEIDRAMNLMIDALRFREVQYDMNIRFFCMSEVHNDMEAWSRYLEKVERELEDDNEAY